MCGGAGSAQSVCITWRSPSRSTKPRNGRTRPTKVHSATKNNPSASMNPELTISSAFAAEGWCPKYEFSSPNQFCNASPISADGARAPISDCVQNHNASAADDATIRSTRPRRPVDAAPSSLDTGRGLQRQFASLAQVQLARSEIRQFLNAHELIVPRPPQSRQIALGQADQAFFQLLVGYRVQDNQALAFFFVRNRRDYKHLLRSARKLLQLFFHLDVRHHLAANFAEPAQAVCHAQKSVLVDGGNVAGVVPAAAQQLRRFLRPLQVAPHHIRAAH